MIIYRALLSLSFAAALAATPVFATTPVHHHASTAHARTTHKLAGSKSRHGSRRARGQQAIQPERVTQIQQALIREHYFTGEANGNWDAATIAAMQKYQADQGWQTKIMPDSRALLKLGLGPDYSTAINAKEGSFTPPAPASSLPAPQAAGFAVAAGVNR